jgi:hypothetical protein
VVFRGPIWNCADTTAFDTPKHQIPEKRNVALRSELGISAGLFKFIWFRVQSDGGFLSRRRNVAGIVE